MQARGAGASACPAALLLQPLGVAGVACRRGASARRGRASARASAALDRSLRYERMIYDAAVVVHDRRCLAHLGSERCAARGGRAPS